MSADWTNAAMVTFAFLWLLTIARNHTLTTQRDRQFERAEVERRAAAIFQAHNHDLKARLHHAESLSTVVPLFRGGLDERGETFPDSFGGAS